MPRSQRSPGVRLTASRSTGRCRPGQSAGRRCRRRWRSTSCPSTPSSFARRSKSSATGSPRRIPSRRVGADPAWNPSQLEYQFTARVPRPDGVDVILVADEYDSGRLDWYAFDLGPKPLGPALDAAADAGESVFSVIPTPAEFPGMPRPRWWQLEDGSVDLGTSAPRPPMWPRSWSPSSRCCTGTTGS